VFGGLGTDTLVLQGSGIGSFDAGQLVDFEAGEKTGTSTWTLTGTNTDITSFTVDDVCCSSTAPLPTPPSP
jgi:autotransporter-associated beta strand protein